MTLRSRLAAFLNPPAQVKSMQPADHRLRDMQLEIRSRIRAGYDSTKSTPENTRHWAQADYLAADASLTPEVRIKLRSQSRYELNENNSYGRGMVDTVVTDTVGSGPHLQMTEFSKSANEEIEKEWSYWMLSTDFVDKLTTHRTSKLVDGEGVAKFINNLSYTDPVAVDLQLIECDHLRSPRFEMEISENYVDGVHLDRFGRPFAYDLLRHHPGSRFWTPTDFYAYDTYPVEQIIHSFNCNRPGQHRGVPEFAPALPLFAFLRRFTLATVAAAETAASVSQVVSTDAPIPEELEDEYSATSFDKFLDTIPIDRNSATVLPNGWKLNQFAAEHPTTTYKMFKHEMIAEIGRCLCIPVNIASADSGESNYSSARFDWLGYERRIQREQNYLARHVVNRVFAEWLLEASLVGRLPRRVATQVLAMEREFGRLGFINRIAHTWNWDGMRDADAQDAAQAQRLRLQNGSTHRAREYAAQGLDVEVEDVKAAESLGVSIEDYRSWVTASIFANGNITNIDEEAGNESQSQGESQPPADDAGDTSREPAASE